jgi:putative ABC transport system permease protein
VEWSRPPTLPATDIQTDWSVLVFACGITLLASLLFTLAPALQGLRQDVLEVLRSGGRTAAPAGHHTRTALVVVEIALGVVLLTGAGLMIRTVGAMNTIDKGFNQRDVLTMRVSMRPREFEDFNKKWQFYSGVLESVRTIPGVRSVGGVRPLPLESVTFTDQVEVPATGQTMSVSSHTTLPGYFPSMGIGLIQGRDFVADDIGGQRDVAVVDERLVRLAWAGVDPLGRRIRVRRGTRVVGTFEVIGVVRHVHAAGLRDSGAPQLYVPYHRNPIFDMALTIKTASDPAAIVAIARDRIDALGGKRPIYRVRPMADYVADATAETRFILILLGAFAGLALMLSSIGLYGVVAYTTAQRTREIAVRVALGASPRDIKRLVVGTGMVWTGCGILIGTAGALGLTRTLESLLFGVSPGDPVTLAGVVCSLTAVALVACYLPARRAARIAAYDALRAD